MPTQQNRDITTRHPRDDPTRYFLTLTQNKPYTPSHTIPQHTSRPAIISLWRTDRLRPPFCAIRSYISTAAKHGKKLFDVLTRLAEGRPWLPETA